MPGAAHLNFDELAKKTMYPKMLEDYDSVAVVHPLIFRRITDMELVSPFGQKSTTMTGMGEPKERKDGDEIRPDQPAEGYQWQTRVGLLSNRLVITERQWESMTQDGLARFLMDKTRGWGKGYQTKKETLASRIFTRGAFTAGDNIFTNTFDDGSETDPQPKKIYDGQPFFATAHPAKVTGTTYSNTLPGLALDSTNFNTAWTRISATNAFDERGMRIGISPTTLLFPPGLRAQAHRVLASQQLPGTSQNDSNENQGIVNPVMWRYLSDQSSGWWLGEAGAGVHYYDSGEPVLKTWFDYNTNSINISAESRFGVGVENFRHWVAANNSTS